LSCLPACRRPPSESEGAPAWLRARLVVAPGAAEEQFTQH
jgi:hypothetical protein